MGVSYQAKSKTQQVVSKSKSTTSRAKTDQGAAAVNIKEDSPQSYAIKKHTKSKARSPVRKPQRKFHQKIQEKLAHKLVSKAKQKKQSTVHLAEIEKYKKELEQYKKDFLYLKAEFDNYKKRTLSERAELSKYRSEALAIEILEVVDIFERALSFKIDPQNIQSFADGIEMVYSSFLNALKRQGIEEVPILGKAFDPHLCNALSREATDKFPPEHISQVIKKCYKLHEKVIRFGQVIVAQKSPGDSSKTKKSVLSS